MENRFCRKCDKIIPHDVVKDTSTGEMIMLSIFTFGIAPILEVIEPDRNSIYAKFAICQRCGNKVDVSPAR